MQPKPGEIVPILTIVSRAERATTRAAREMARRQAEQFGRLAPGERNDGIAITRDELIRLTTCHRATYGKTEWREAAARAPLAAPVRTSEREKTARRALATYHASWQERMFGDEAQRRRQLTSRVFEAAREDEALFQRARREVETYNAEAAVARGVLELHPRAIKEAVASKTRLAELREGMNSISLAPPAGRRVVAVVDALAEADVACERLVGEDTRAARREPIPAQERRRIHLAALCAAGLRTGAELLGLLPVEAVEVIVNCELPEPDRGRPTSQPAIQLLVTGKSLADHDWQKTDAVSLAAALGARMDWSIEKGFTPIRLAALGPAGEALAKSA